MEEKTRNIAVKEPPEENKSSHKSKTVPNQKSKKMKTKTKNIVMEEPQKNNISKYVQKIVNSVEQKKITDPNSVEPDNNQKPNILKLRQKIENKTNIYSARGTNPGLQITEIVLDKNTRSTGRISYKNQLDTNSRRSQDNSYNK